MKMSYNQPEVGTRGIRTLKYTMSMNYTDQGISDTVLYDNINDPYQVKNIARSNPELVSSLLGQLHLEMERIDDPAKPYFD